MFRSAISRPCRISLKRSIFPLRRPRLPLGDRGLPSVRLPQLQRLSLAKQLPLEHHAGDPQHPIEQEQRPLLPADRIHP